MNKKKMNDVKKKLKKYPHKMNATIYARNLFLMNLLMICMIITIHISMQKKFGMLWKKNMIQRKLAPKSTMWAVLS